MLYKVSELMILYCERAFLEITKKPWMSDAFKCINCASILHSLHYDRHINGTVLGDLVVCLLLNLFPRQASPCCCADRFKITKVSMRCHRLSDSALHIDNVHSETEGIWEREGERQRQNEREKERGGPTAIHNVCREATQ